MAKLPSREDLGPLPPARTGAPIASYRKAIPDIASATSLAASATRQSGLAIARGLQDVGQGLAQINADIEREKQKDEALAVIKAKARRDIGMMELDRSLGDGDYTTYEQRYLEGAKKLNEQFSADLPDDDLRERWLPEVEVDTERNRASVLDRAKKLKDEADFSGLVESMDAHRAILLSDTATPEQKAEAKRSIADGIEVAQARGLITPQQKEQFANKFIQGVAKEEVDMIRARDPEEAARKVVFKPKAAGVAKMLMDEYGLTKEQAAGIVGNFGHETGGFTYYKEIGSGPNTGGRGWSQWTGPRRQAFLNWSAQNGLDPRSDEANWGFFKADPETAAAIDAVKRTGSVEDAMLVFEQSFLRAGKKNYPSRLRYANEALDAFDSGGDEFADLDPVDRAKAEGEVKKDLADREKVGTPYEAQGWLEDVQMGTRVADPLDPDDKKRTNVLSEGAVESLMNKDQDYFDGQILPLVKDTRVIPSNIKGAFEAQLRSKDPGTIVFALSNLDALEKQNPVAFSRDMGSDAVGLVARYRAQLMFHKPQEIAAMLGAEQGDKVKADARKSLMDDGKKEAEKLAPYVAGFFSGEKPWLNANDKLAAAATWLGVGPDMPEGNLSQELQEDFKQVFSAAMAETGGDKNTAMAMAIPVLKKRWGTSSVTGEDRLMRLPPEQVLNPEGLDPSWIKRQARARLQPLIGDNPFDLRADDRTEMELQNGSTPTYPVFVKPGYRILGAQ